MLRLTHPIPHPQKMQIRNHHLKDNACQLFFFKIWKSGLKVNAGIIIVITVWPVIFDGQYVKNNTKTSKTINFGDLKH